MISVGVIGASGYTGAELLRISAGHPELDVKLATADTRAGTRIGDVYPNLLPAFGDAVFQSYDSELAHGLDLVFLSLPHGASQAILPDLLGKVGTIVDLSADFRLQDPTLYPTWYGQDHSRPELLSEFVYGLPELFRDEIREAKAIAAPGCYVTAALLALAPLVRSGLVEPTGVVVDAASGVSGAGRALKDNTTFCAVDENFTAYGLTNHRHTPEIEQGLSRLVGQDGQAQVLFTPHLAPMNRGILATCYVRPVGPATQSTTDDLLDLLREAWDGEPFVTVTREPPSTKATLGSNSAHVTAVADPRTGMIVAIGALDNLVKGASGQAVQCANLAIGLPEDTGLAASGLYP